MAVRQRKQKTGRHRFLHKDVSVQGAVAEEESVIKNSENQ